MEKFIPFSIDILSQQTKHCFGLYSVWREIQDIHLFQITETVEVKVSGTFVDDLCLIMRVGQSGSL